MTALWQMDAAELAPLIAAGAVSARETVRSVLDRLDAVNPKLNAIVQFRHEQALAEADAADARRRRGEPLGGLHGIPVTIKINTDMLGHPTDNGVIAYKALMPTEDAPVVTNLRQAGAIVVGRTNTPCYSMRWFTANDLHGETRNPWGTAITPGGSSGGAGSAVAAGIGPIGQGNDIAGSVRYPAYCCGLVGLRPSFGRVPSFNSTAPGPSAMSSQLMAVQGPLTRRVRDARLAFAAMARPHLQDPRVAALSAPDDRPGLRRAAVVGTPGNGPVHPAIKAAVAEAGRALEAAGYIVETVEPPEFQLTAELWGRLGGPDTVAGLEPLIEANGDAGIRRGLAFWRAAWPDRDPATALAAQAERSRLLRAWSAYFARFSVAVMPVSRALPYPPDADIQNEASAVALLRTQEPMLAISVLGLPAVSVPTGTAEGRPVGVQVVSAPFRDEWCLDAAAIIEAHYPMPTPIDPVAAPTAAGLFG